MWKAIVAGAVALTIGSASLVYAQMGPRGRMSPEDAQAFVDARIAGMKEGLKLTPEQEKNWPAVEAAIRDLAKERIARMEERRARGEARRDDRAQREPRDGISLLRERADALTRRAEGLKRLADAAEPLYKSLDENQKRRLHILSQGLRARGEADGHHWRRDRESREGRHHRRPRPEREWYPERI